MSITLLQFAKEIGIASKDATSITNLTPEKLGELLQTISSIKSQRDEETKHNSDLASVKTLETKIAEASNNKNLDELNILEGQKGEHENTLEELKKELKSKQQLLKKSQATLNLIEKYTQIKTPLFEPILLDLMNEVGAEKFMEGIKSITSEKNSEKNEWKIRGILHDSKTMLSIYKKLNQDDKKTFAKLYFNSYARHEILIDPVQPPGSTDQKSTTVLFGSLLDAALYFGEDFKTLSDLIASSNWETQSRITTISDNFTVSDNFTDREEKLYSFNLIASSTSLKPAQKRALLNDMLKKSDQRHKSLLNHYRLSSVGWCSSM